MGPQSCYEIVKFPATGHIRDTRILYEFHVEEEKGYLNSVRAIRATRAMRETKVKAAKDCGYPWLSYAKLVHSHDASPR